MVRTKANTGCGARVSVEKAPRKNFGGSSSSFDLGSPSSKKDKFAGGNPVCKRPTPEWQKPISKFFMPRMEDKENDDGGSPPKIRQVSEEEEKENTRPQESAGSSSSASAGCPKSSKEQATDKPSSSKAGSSTANGCVVSVDDAISEED